MARYNTFFREGKELKNVGTLESPRYEFEKIPYLSEARHPVTCKEQVGDELCKNDRQNGSSRCYDHSVKGMLTARVVATPIEGAAKPKRKSTKKRS